MIWAIGSIFILAVSAMILLFKGGRTEDQADEQTYGNYSDYL